MTQGLASFSFIELKRDNFTSFEKIISSLESIFPKEIRTDTEEYEDILSEETSIAKLMFVESQHVGSIFGFKLDDEDLANYNITDCKNIIYLFSIAIDEQHQGKGYGRKIFQEFIRAAVEKGYERVLGHFRKNGSLKLMLSFGGREIKTCPDWEGTGEEFILCELSLDKFKAV